MAVLGGRFGVSVAFGLRWRIIRIVGVVRISGIIWIRRIRFVVGIRAEVEEVQDGVIVVVSEDSLIPADHVMAAVIGVIFGGGVVVREVVAIRVVRVAVRGRIVEVVDAVPVIIAERVIILG